MEYRGRAAPGGVAGNHHRAAPRLGTIVPSMGMYQQSCGIGMTVRRVLGSSYPLICRLGLASDSALSSTPVSLVGVTFQAPPPTPPLFRRRFSTHLRGIVPAPLRGIISILENRVKDKLRTCAYKHTYGSSIGTIANLHPSTPRQLLRVSMVIPLPGCSNLA